MPSIKVGYIKNEDYSPVYVNGAIGGVNIRGEMVVNFYIETNVLPQDEAIDIKDGQLVPRSQENSDPSVININRLIHTGVIMNITTATELYNWLGQQLETFKQNTKSHGGAQ